jgi:polar amino acid transport system substrate-binding protein
LRIRRRRAPSTSSRQTAQYEPGLYGIAVAKDQAGLRGTVQAALGHVIGSGEYRHVLQRWGVVQGAVRSASVNGAMT